MPAASLDLLPLLDAPFTPTMAAAAGVPRSALERQVRTGAVVRVLRGVYLRADRELGPQDRAAALSLVLGRRQAAVGRTAAWLHGCAPDALLIGLDPARGIPVELRSVADLRDRSVRIGEVRSESALDAALSLVPGLPGPAAVAALDSLLRAGALRAGDLYDACTAHPLVREAVARSDARAGSAAESVLRHHWLDSRLPTPVPGMMLDGVRVALALPWHRFAVTVGGARPGRPVGWTVVNLPEDRVLATGAELTRAHLEREFHQHLLTQVG